MLVYGLTGGIACGKSTVAKMFAGLGAAVVDADRIAREVVEPGKPAHEEILREFGRQVLAADGRIDRPALGNIVFGDEVARKKLNAITHPRIFAESARRLNLLREQGTKIVLYEAALLVETGAHRSYAGLIVVSAPEDVQLARLMERDGIGEEAARQKINSQLPLEEKRKVADYVIDNGGALEETRRQVEEVWVELQKEPGS